MCAKRLWFVCTHTLCMHATIGYDMLQHDSRHALPSLLSLSALLLVVVVSLLLLLVVLSILSLSALLL